jgi:hypothetical protein
MQLPRALSRCVQAEPHRRLLRVDEDGLCDAAGSRERNEPCKRFPGALAHEHVRGAARLACSVGACKVAEPPGARGCTGALHVTHIGRVFLRLSSLVNPTRIAGGQLSVNQACRALRGGQGRRAGAGAHPRRQRRAPEAGAGRRVRLARSARQQAPSGAGRRRRRPTRARLTPHAHAPTAPRRHAPGPLHPKASLQPNHARSSRGAHGRQGDAAATAGATLLCVGRRRDVVHTYALVALPATSWQRSLT